MDAAGLVRLSWDDAIDGVDADTPGGRMPRTLRIARQMPAQDAANDDPADDLPDYAELHALSDFSFLRGAASAEELFVRAAQCGYEALAITDECSLAGIVRAWDASRHTPVRLIVGSEFTLACGTKLVLLVENKAGYTRLCRLITTARMGDAKKGRYRLRRADIEALATGDGLHGLFALWCPARQPNEGEGAWLRGLFGERAWLAIELHREDDDAARLASLLGLAERLQLRALASGDVHMATRRQRMLQDTMTAIRHGLPLAEAGGTLFRNGERHLRSRRALGNIFPAPLLEEAVALARRCTFRMDEVKYQYPRELVPAGETPTTWLRKLTLQGARRRWPQGIPRKIKRQIAAEMLLVAELQYEPFFLTVHDIVRFAESRNILCQGRGSAANSVICYALHITAVNPEETRLLMARFLSAERKEPPDIDVDFEHERREEVMQYVYNKYGRNRAALAATVIRYRGKSAMRDVAKAFGMGVDEIAKLASCRGWGNKGTPLDKRLDDAGFDIANSLLQRILHITDQLEGKPRHLSQHVGGFIISDAPLHHLVPVENAAMADRTVIQWEKDDLESLGLLKVDCLALGMLTCIRKALALVLKHRARDLTIATIPTDDAPTYDMICAADTVGVFQIESRAQMAMLPRLKPRRFYDLVIEVAIVRPGPIQGGMVHPYLRRRMGKETVTFPSDGIRDILKDTMGVPLFQEQVMELVIHAGYTPAEADDLRRSMAAWRHGGDMEPHRLRIADLMREKNYSEEFIAQIFEQIKGFGSYGFPQSHSASFAKLVYASCWLKRHEPAAFYCALLNSQPMGFYSPAQIVQDARRSTSARDTVEFLPVDVQYSDMDYTLVDDPAQPARQPAIRIGLRSIMGLSKQAAEAIVRGRNMAPFRDIDDLCRRARLDAKARHVLADSGALRSLSRHRNEARWAITGFETDTPLLRQSSPENIARLPAPSVGEEVGSDYRSTGLTLGPHPCALLREALRRRRIRSSGELMTRHHGAFVQAAGLVTQRQRPATAKGTIFVTLEDEHGMVNVVVWADLASRYRKAVLESRLLAVRGRWEQVDGVSHLIAGHLEDLTPMLGDLRTESRDFR